MKKNMAFKVIDRLFIVVYGVVDPTDEEWRGYLELVERHGIDRTMQLVCTDGGGPTAAQGRRLNDLLDGRTVPVAVVSSSARVRGTVTALSWFNRRLKAFPPAGLRDAIAYLEVPESRNELIENELEKLRRSLGLDDVVEFGADQEASGTSQRPGGGIVTRARPLRRLGCTLLALVALVAGGTGWVLTRTAERAAPEVAP